MKKRENSTGSCDLRCFSDTRWISSSQNLGQNAEWILNAARGVHCLADAVRHVDLVSLQFGHQLTSTDFFGQQWQWEWFHSDLIWIYLDLFGLQVFNLEELGVGFIWLSPIMKSPMRDFGRGTRGANGFYWEDQTMVPFQLSENPTLRWWRPMKNHSCHSFRGDMVTFQVRFCCFVEVMGCGCFAVSLDWTISKLDEVGSFGSPKAMWPMAPVHLQCRFRLRHQRLPRHRSPLRFHAGGQNRNRFQFWSPETSALQYEAVCKQETSGNQVLQTWEHHFDHPLLLPDLETVWNLTFLILMHLAFGAIRRTSKTWWLPPKRLASNCWWNLSYKGGTAAMGQISGDLCRLRFDLHFVFFWGCPWGKHGKTMENISIFLTRDSSLRLDRGDYNHWKAIGILVVWKPILEWHLVDAIRGLQATAETTDAVWISCAKDFVPNHSSNEFGTQLTQDLNWRCSED